MIIKALIIVKTKKPKNNNKVFRLKWKTLIRKDSRISIRESV